MSVAFDAETSSLTFQGTTITVGHTPSGTPRGVLVLIVEDGPAADGITGITYGGSTLTEMTNSPFVGTNSEAGTLHAYFLGVSVPSGTQNAVITPSSSLRRLCSVITLTGADDLEENIVSQLLDQNGGASPTANLALSGVESFVVQSWISGRPSVGDVTPLSGWTDRGEGDFQANTGGVYTYDTIGTADVTCGYTSSTDNAQLLGVAINEVAGGGGGTILPFITNYYRGTN